MNYSQKLYDSSRFPYCMVCYIAFGSASSVCSLVKSIAISLTNNVLRNNYYRVNNQVRNHLLGHLEFFEYFHVFRPFLIG